MKLPRLQYTYAVFYRWNNGNLEGSGMADVNVHCRIKKIEHLMDIRQSIQRKNAAGILTITNYKLLSVRMAWE